MFSQKGKRQKILDWANNPKIDAQLDASIKRLLNHEAKLSDYDYFYVYEGSCVYKKISHR